MKMIKCELALSTKILMDKSTYYNIKGGHGYQMNWFRYIQIDSDTIIIKV